MFIHIQQTNIYYEVHGEGPPLLLLHGWGTSLRLFDDLVSRLKNEYKIYALDFPGFGESEEPPFAWTVHDYANMTENFILKMKLNNPIVLGHSFGGRIATILGSQKKTGPLVLVDSAGIRPKRSFSYKLKVLIYKVVRNAESVPGMKFAFGDLIDAYKKSAGSADYKMASFLMKKVLSQVVNEDLQDFMPNISVPVLLMWGESDNDTPVSDGRRMEALIPSSTLTVLKDAGHYSFLDKPELFFSHVYQFLKGADTPCTSA